MQYQNFSILKLLIDFCWWQQCDAITYSWMQSFDATTLCNFFWTTLYMNHNCSYNKYTQDHTATHPHVIQPQRNDFVDRSWINQLTINGIKSPECWCYKLSNIKYVYYRTDIKFDYWKLWFSTQLDSNFTNSKLYSWHNQLDIGFFFLVWCQTCNFIVQLWHANLSPDKVAVYVARCDLSHKQTKQTSLL